MKYTYEAILANPGLLEEIEVAARRERARAVRALIVEPVQAVLAERAASPDLARQACKA